jgi:1-acyl-sn-glycerol-3-phosphate acyltransferase
MAEKQEKTIQRIDIKKVFYDKNPKLARLLPGFIYRYLKRIIHEDFTNEFLLRHGNKYDLDFVNASIEDFNVSIKVEGEDKIPGQGRFIFVSNHPLGGFDGLVIMHVVDRYFKNYKFLVNDILMNIKNLAGLFIPINKHGRQDSRTAEELDELFRSDIQLLTFPAGLVSRRIKGQIVDLEWHKNFITKAKQYQRDIIPIHMSGRNTNFFYRLYTIRKFLGIKAALEMLYLADETYKHKNKSLCVKFGDPISWKTFNNSKRPTEWAKWVKQKVYALDGVTSIPL